MECNCEFFEVSDLDVEGSQGEMLESEELLGEQEAADNAEKNQLKNLMKEIEVDAKEKLSTDNPDTAPCPDTVQCPDPDERLPDGERLIDLSAPVTEGEGPVHEIPAEKFPKTLSECLVSGNLWPHLWQLLVWLRCGSEGMDSEYLKKAEVVRRRAEKMNWFQTLCKTLQNHPAFLCTKPGLGFFDLLMFWHQSLSH